MDKQEDETQYGTITYVRLPDDVREQVESGAKSEERTISSQIVVLLRYALQARGTKKEIEKQRRA